MSEKPYWRMSRVEIDAVTKVRSFNRGEHRPGGNSFACFVVLRTGGKQIWPTRREVKRSIYELGWWRWDKGEKCANRLPQAIEERSAVVINFYDEVVKNNLSGYRSGGATQPGIQLFLPTILEHGTIRPNLLPVPFDWDNLPSLNANPEPWKDQLVRVAAIVTDALRTS